MENETCTFAGSVLFLNSLAGMSLVIPFLPLYIEKLGVRRYKLHQQMGWYCIWIYLLMAAIVSPLWGSLADK